MYRRSSVYPEVDSTQRVYDYIIFVFLFLSFSVLPFFSSALAGQLVYSTFLGGSINESGNAITVDTAGCVYITGWTNSSTDFPTTGGAYDISFNGIGTNDVFVTKMNATGSTLVYSTFLGGSNDETGNDILVDSNGNAYITGYTNSPNFPTYNAYDSTFNGDTDVFFSVLDPTGSSLLYSTFLGGSNADIGFDIALDTALNVYITGETHSSSFPTTVGAYTTTYSGSTDCFVTKINTLALGTASLVYSTFLGGSNYDGGKSIAVDNSGNAYIAGGTKGGFPTTAGAFDTTFNSGPTDGFVSKISTLASGTASLVYSTYLGGSSDEEGISIAVDTDGYTYVTGFTSSVNFPIIAGAYDADYNGGACDVFLSKLNTTGSLLIYSTFLGGSGYDEVFCGAIDNERNFYITGVTRSSTDFPVTSGAFDTTFNGGTEDVIISKLNNSGSSLLYSTFLGANNDEGGSGITVDSFGNIYVTGYTRGIGFPVTPMAFDTSYNGGASDAIVVKLSFPPSVENAIYSDINNNLSVDSGDKVTIQFDKRMKVNSATTADFYLPVTGDKLGTGATIAVNPFNDTQVVITLGICSLRIDGVFSSNTTSAGSPSGIDISASMIANHIEDLDGLDAQPSGIKDILYTLSSATVYVTAFSAATVQVSQDTINDYYLQHKLIIPKDSLATSTTITAGLPGDTHGSLSAVSFGPPGLTFSAATPSTLIIEYKEGDMRRELGYMENALRIHQWKSPDSTWVMLPETYSQQSVDTTNRTVSVKIDKFNMVGTGASFAFAGSNTTIVYANIDLPTVYATTTPVSYSKGFLATPTTYISVGTTGIYTKHKLTLTEYIVDTASSITVTLCQPTLQEKHGWQNYAALKIVTNGIITTSAKLTMEYKDSDDTVYNQYRNDVSGGNEHQMRVYHWNESLLQWEQLTTQWPSDVDAANNTITSSLPANQLSGTQIYALRVDPMAPAVELSRFEAIIPNKPE